jgi:hypothetical protein
VRARERECYLRRDPDVALEVAAREVLHGLHEVLERVPVLVLAAAALVERDRGERGREHLAGAALDVAQVVLHSSSF